MSKEFKINFDGEHLRGEKLLVTKYFIMMVTETKEEKGFKEMQHLEG